MKYYLIKCTNSLPNGFGGTTQGPLIKLLPKYKNDVGLIEHEKTHVRQWYAAMVFWLFVCTLLALLVSPACWTACGVAPCVHQVLYKFVRPYRRWCEVQAYRKQITVGGYTSNEFAVTFLAEKYELNLSASDARALLLNRLDFARFSS